MTARHSYSPEIARRYARALYDLAADQGVLSRVRNVVETLSQALSPESEDSDLAAVLNQQSIPRAEKQKAMAEILKAAGASPLLQDFVAIVIENGRAGYLATILEAFTALDAEREGKMTVEVATPRALTPAQEKDLIQHLARQTGKDISLDVSVDESLIAGLVLRIGSTLYDASLKTKLDNLHKTLKQPQDF